MATAPSLFGATPEGLYQAQQAALNTSATDYANMNPFQRANYGIYKGASNLGGAIGGMLGGQDPMMARASQMRDIASQSDTSTPEGLSQYARSLAGAGFNQEALGASQAAQDMNQKAVNLSTSQATLAKDTLSNEQEAELRTKLQALPQDATEADIISVVSRYGKPESIMQALQRTEDKRVWAQGRVDVANVQATAAMERLKETNTAKEAAAAAAGATKVQLAQMSMDGRNQLAQLAASLKGPSVAEQKLQDARDKAAEGKVALADTVNTMQGLITKLGQAGGMSSTGSSGFSNLLSKGQTSSGGQWLGQAFGTENQANRDVISSLRLQLLNDIKTSEKMGSGQLNSNVELETWLKSLGSPGSTVEANQAILKTISNRYLNKGNPQDSIIPGIGGQPKNEVAVDPQRAQAAQWLQANPNDPRAAAIRQKAGL